MSMRSVILPEKIQDRCGICGNHDKEIEYMEVLGVHFIWCNKCNTISFFKEIGDKNKKEEVEKSMNIYLLNKQEKENKEIEKRQEKKQVVVEIPLTKEELKHEKKEKRLREKQEKKEERLKEKEERHEERLKEKEERHKEKEDKHKIKEELEGIEDKNKKA